MVGLWNRMDGTWLDVSHFNISFFSTGDVCSGKSTLIDRLCQISPSKGRRSHSSQGKFLLSGCSLEYRFINVQDEDTDGMFCMYNVCKQ